MYYENIIRAGVTCRKRHCKSYRYPPSSPLTPLGLDDLRPFFTVGIDNFGPVFVPNIYFVKNDTMHKARVTLYTCAASRAICLDLVPNMYSASFIRNFKRFILRYGCPDNVISDNESNFVSDDSRNCVACKFIEWHLNLPLAPWYGGHFERRSVKDLLIKNLKGRILSYEEMQTVLFECEAILNNHQLKYIYSTDLTSCLTPNNLLYGRVIQSSSIQSSSLSHDPHELTTYSNQVTTVINRFFNKWRYEYLANLRGTHKHYSTNKNQSFIQVNDVVLVHSDKTPRSMWRMGVVTELIEGKMDNNIRGTLVR